VRPAPALAAAILLAFGPGCADEARVEQKGWKNAIACVEALETHKDCREPDRKDAPYATGWNAAIACMEANQNLRLCREPALEGVASAP
jgi:hypothetical protein